MLTPPFVPPGGAGLDVTDAEAVEWFKGYLAEAEAQGLDGSMTDFGEWVPFDAQFEDGSTGAETHNRYPLLWQKANREFWDAARPDGDFLFYVRSGYTGTQQFAPAFWGGDQNTTYDRLDGLGSVVTLGVNLGLSGIPFYGHDIAGYSAFAIEGVEDTPTDRELFLRWASIGAYTPMMRTHHGSRYGENWSFEGGPNPAKPEEPLADPSTLEVWKTLAAEHISLFPYQQAYGQEAVERGVPIMRHPLLVYPDDPVFAGELPDEPAWAEFDAVSLPEGETFQYFLGDELLVAPVIDEGATERPVYLPSGDWVEIHTGERIGGPTTVTAPAEPGEIAVYAPAGAVIPRLPEGVETLAPTDDPDIVDHTDVEDELVVDVVAGADGSFTLVDGTSFELTGDAVFGGEVTATVDGDAVEGDRRGAPRRRDRHGGLARDRAHRLRGRRAHPASRRRPARPQLHGPPPRLSTWGRGPGPRTAVAVVWSSAAEVPSGSGKLQPDAQALGVRWIREGVGCDEEPVDGGAIRPWHGGRPSPSVGQRADVERSSSLA